MSALRRVTAELGRALRESGAALDAAGLRALEKPLFKEPFARHRPVSALGDLAPSVSPDAFVAPSATVVGDVTLGPRAAVMYGAVVRGDLAPVALGAGSVVGARECGGGVCALRPLPARLAARARALPCVLLPTRSSRAFPLALASLSSCAPLLRHRRGPARHARR